jgi:hypothetical protein
MPPSAVINDIWDFVDSVVCPVHSVRHNDGRDPPGDHCGTGWFLEVNGLPRLCTCEHVACLQEKGKIGYAPAGSEFGTEVGSKFNCFPHPVDFAIADTGRMWNVFDHKGKLISEALLADRHEPVEGEFLYLQGFPGGDAKPLYGQHNVKGLSAYLHQIAPPPEIYSEKPPFIDACHICLAWSTADAIPLNERAGHLSLPDGLSGSPLWNTRFLEAAKENREWRVSDMRVTAIVWGASFKANAVTATPIEHFRKLIL